MSQPADIEEALSVPETPARASDRGSLPSYRSWTIPRLMEELRRRGVPFPASARKGELFNLLNADQAPRGSQAAAQDQVSSASLSQLHTMMTEVLTTVSGFKARLDLMELSRSDVAVPTAASPTASTSQATPSGMPHPPPIITPAHFIPAAIKKDILEGKEVNLASLLIATTDVHDTKTVACGELAVTFKSKDARLSRKLSVTEFVLAFGLFRDVLCSVSPGRREELDLYLHRVVQMAYKYGGTTFYEYHKSFSAKVAAAYAQFGYVTNWGSIDTELYCEHFAGLKAPSCTACGVTTHSSSWCPQVSNPGEPSTSRSLNAFTPPAPRNVAALDRLGRPVRYLGKTQICNNFNLSSCVYSNCRLLHVCFICFRAHPSSICSQKGPQA
ncbi:uncharacterized protein LOC130283477 [Hyla sarda]|uniref:uncharacterized protein LOC130283477 n=1 Tax=Hyla sarda TaxID=327740 RepID=UPI0024C29712|nr:uncharacterized protein LOC130283477 [Hyla sarda]